MFGLRSRPTPVPHSRRGTLTMESFGLPSMCNSSLLSLMSLHLTGAIAALEDELLPADTGFKFDPEFAAVILIFFTVPKP